MCISDSNNSVRHDFYQIVALADDRAAHTSGHSTDSSHDAQSPVLFIVIKCPRALARRILLYYNGPISISKLIIYYISHK